MPLNYLEARKDIQEIAKKAPAFQKELSEQLIKAQELLLIQNDLKSLRRKVEKADDDIKNLRCAKPTGEEFSQAYSLPNDVESAMIIAADGSQTYPDRNLPINFYAVNVGVISYPLNLPNYKPSVEHRTKITSLDKLYSEGKFISPEEINFDRDEEERKILADLVQNLNGIENIFTLTDGNLEIWINFIEKKAEKQKKLKPYFKALKQLRDANSLTAGYVDRPRARLVVELLEVANTPIDELKNLPQNRKFQGVIDRSLFKNILTTSGDRSALFEIQSDSTALFSEEDEDLALYFFYINVGTKDFQRIARVEIPAWVATKPSELNKLHSLIFQQCIILGDERYPYVLHRSHEEAVVKQEHRDEILQMLIQEYLKNGISINNYSAKQSLKNLSGKRRYKQNGRKR